MQVTQLDQKDGVDHGVMPAVQVRQRLTVSVQQAAGHEMAVGKFNGQKDGVTHGSFYPHILMVCQLPRNSGPGAHNALPPDRASSPAVIR